jgi:hypothetical protein
MTIYNNKISGDKKQTLSRGALYIGADYPFDLNIATKLIGIIPTYLWEQKKDWLRGVVNIPQSIWGYELPLRQYDSTDIPTNEILNLFLPKKNIIVPFIKDNKLSCAIDVLIHIHQDDLCCNPVCEILPDTAIKLAELQVTFQITPYFHY